MTYEPITEKTKQEWIEWLNSQVNVLNGKAVDNSDNRIFETGDGDIATGKDLVGNLLALLTNKPITID